MREEKRNGRTARNIVILFLMFSVILLTSGIVAYNLAAAALKNQLVMKCQALAATVATVIAEDSDRYAAFLENMDMDTDYYRETKALMMKLKQVNVEHVTYVYTEAYVDGNTKMYVIGGEHPSSPVYTGPGVKEAMTKAEQISYKEQSPTLGADFEDTEYGVRLSAYEPIFHKDTGEFLGLVGADITLPQYNGIMRIFVVQTAVSLIIGVAVFAISMRWLSGSVKLAMNAETQALFLQNRLARENYEHLKKHLNEVGGLKHEIRNHLAAMQTYLQDGRYEEARDYLAQYAEQAGTVTEAVFNDNFLINAVVGNLLQTAKERGIKVKLNLKAVPEHISDPDLYSLLTNILENALEACTGLPAEREKFINLTISRRDPYLIIVCKNSKKGEIISLNGKILTSKTAKGHGYGLWTIERIVDAYDGMMDTDYDENTFMVTVAIKDNYGNNSKLK